MPLPLNTFGLLGEKGKRNEEILPSFGGTERFQEFGLRTVDATPVIAQQVFFPVGDPGSYLFELWAGAVATVSGTTLVIAGGYVGCSVNAAGVVTLNADAQTGLVDYNSASGVTNVTVTKRDATSTLPAALNINVVGTTATFTWAGRIRLVHSVTRDMVLPLGRSDITPSRPAI
jgi:hypothetical protein